MGHEHNHHHHHLQSITGDLKKIYICAIILNALFVAFEAWMGFHSDSLSLVSDAGHKLVDVFSLCLTLFAFILASSRPGKNFTFGFRKLTVLISLLNAVFVVIIAGSIIYESIEKMLDPSSLTPDGTAISITAAVGIVINAISVTLLSYKRRHDVNTRGAFIHMLTDCLLMEDQMGRVIYDTVDKLATAMRVSRIVTVPVMENLSRTSGSYAYALGGIIVNLADYNVGADKGGAVNMFDDFDIDYNAQKYLIETRCSGALIKPYSAIALEFKSAASNQEDPGNS